MSFGVMLMVLRLGLVSMGIISFVMLIIGLVVRGNFLVVGSRRVGEEIRVFNVFDLLG